MLQFSSLPIPRPTPPRTVLPRWHRHFPSLPRSSFQVSTWPSIATRFRNEPYEMKQIMVDTESTPSPQPRVQESRIGSVQNVRQKANPSWKHCEIYLNLAYKHQCIIKKENMKLICMWLYGFMMLMISWVASMGHGYTGPNYHALRVPLLKEAKAQVNLTILSLRSKWVETGCTIMGDGWTDRIICH
ncbi:hypothetical protein ACS0TY_011107 [Phlomoides rotata]